MMTLNRKRLGRSSKTRTAGKAMGGLISGELFLAILGWVCLYLVAVPSSFAEYSLDPIRKVDWSYAGYPGDIPQDPVTRNAVTDDGAAGDGQTDDTAAIQSCLNNAGLNGVCFLPEGTYLISATLLIPSNTTFRGTSQQAALITTASPITMIKFDGNSSSTMSGIISGYNRGSRTIEVVDNSGFSPRDYITVYQRNYPDCADTDCLYSGRHTGGDNASILTDTTKSWAVNKWVGYKLRNTTDDSEGTIVSNTENAITVTLSGTLDDAVEDEDFDTQDYYIIYHAGDDSHPVEDDEESLGQWQDNLMGEMVQIVAVNDNYLTLDRGLYTTYYADHHPVASRISPVTNAGIENLTLHNTNSGGGHIILIESSAEIWVRNVKSRYARKYHVYFKRSARCEVRKSWFEYGYDYGGDAAYGAAVMGGSSDNLIENNIFYYMRHSMIFQDGGMGNVFGYNYSLDPVNGREENTDFLMIDMVFHGGHSMYNLFEGNIGAKMAADNALGSSRFNTFFRTQATCSHTFGSGIVSGKRSAEIQMNNAFQNFIGTVHGSTDELSGQTDWRNGCDQSPCTRTPGEVSGGTDSRVNDTNNVRHGWVNFGGSTVNWDSAEDARTNGDHGLPASLYLPGKPAFFGPLTWPSIGPDVSGYANTIPAKYYYDNGSWPAESLPTAVIDSPAGDQEIVVNDSLSFSGTISDPGGGLVSAAWHFDGAAQDYTCPQSTEPLICASDPVQFTAEGRYTVTLTGADTEGATDVDTIVVTVRSVSQANPDPGSSGGSGCFIMGLGR